MAYSGKYKVKNRSKYQGDPDNVVYRSHWEKNCFQWCDKNTEIKYWSSEEIVVPYFFDVDKRYHRYFVDLKIVMRDGRTRLIEIKPEKETKVPKGDRRTKRFLTEATTYVKNMNKWEAAEKFAKQNGWTFEIWTEKTLREMKILPKPLKKIKPLKPMATKRKKKPTKK